MFSVGTFENTWSKHDEKIYMKLINDRNAWNQIKRLKEYCEKDFTLNPVYISHYWDNWNWNCGKESVKIANFVQIYISLPNISCYGVWVLKNMYYFKTVWA